jgi:hypothetical protein
MIEQKQYDRLPSAVKRELESLQRQRDFAVRQLRAYEDSQTPSDIWATIDSPDPPACASLTSFEQADEDMAEWVKREFGKGQIDRAGSLLVPWWSNPNPGQPEGFSDAVRIVLNWRSSHGLPLNVFQATLRLRAKRVEPNVIVAQRLKRFLSIMNKLVREPTMKLSQMQDLGGCRAILSDVAAVDRLYGLYRGGEPLPPTEVGLKCYDYIREPKDDGYRGIHIVGRYHPRTNDRKPWDGQRVEIQLRSR